MKALIRGTEVIMEPFSIWVENNIEFLIEADGWELVENYEPPVEEDE